MEDWIGAPRFCLIADRDYDVATLRAWLAQQGIKTIIPACAQRTNSQPHASERYLVHSHSDSARL